jgi:uncharacterized protein YeaO (DUF488 family)
MVRLKRADESAQRSDGYRVLVDRLWPRGVRKTKLKLDDWQKDVAPSARLRQWFQHDPERWVEFKRRYRAELRRTPASNALRALVERAATGKVTLVFWASDRDHNNAVVLREVIERRQRKPRSPKRPSASASTGRSKR